MEPRQEHDIEYQSLVDNPSETGYQVNLTENQLRIFCLFIFWIEAITTFGVTLAFFGSFFYCEIEYVIGNFIGLCLNIIFLSLIANGLFGKKNRGTSIHIYSVFYHLIPAILYMISFVVLCFKFDAYMEWAQSDTVHPRVWVLTPIFFTCMLILYHGFAAWVLRKYKLVQREHDPSF